MAFEKRDMSGALFKNTKKEKETHPDLSGDCIVNGQEMWVSGWTKEGKNGRFISLSFKPKKPVAAPEPAVEAPDFDDDVPF